MIQEALKVIAEFKDEASAGLSKLRENLVGVGEQAGVLKPLEDNKAAEGIRRVDTEANRAATGGLSRLGGLANSIRSAFSGLGGTISTTVSGAAEGLGVVGQAASDAVSQFAATAAGVVVGSRGIGSATSVLRNSFQGVKDAVNAATDTFEKYRAAVAEALNAQQAVAAFQQKFPALFAYRETFAGGAPQRAAAGSELAARRAELRKALEAERKATGITLTKKDTDALTKSIDEAITKATELYATFRSNAANIARQSVSALANTFLSLAQIGGSVFIGLVAAIDGIGFAIKNAADSTDELAQKLGITIKELETFKILAAENGTSVETLVRTYDRLTRVLAKSDEESKKANEAFATLGITQEELAGLTEREVAGKIVQAYEELGKTTEATGAVQQLLGQSFRENVPAIKEAAANFADYTARVEKFGAEVGRGVIDAAGRQEKAVTDLGLAFKGLGNSIAAASSEGLTAFINGLADVINSIRQANVVTAPAKIVFQTLAVLFANLAFVAKGVGREIGGIAAQLAALARGDFKAFKAIGDALKEDARIAREELDAYEKRVLGLTPPPALAGQTAEDAKAAADAARRERELAAAREKARLEAKKAADEQTKSFNDAKQGLLSQLGLLGKTTELEKMRFETESGRYAKLNPQQKQELLALAEQIDAKNRLLELDRQRQAVTTNLDALENQLSLDEQIAQLAGLTADERERETIFLTEINRLQREGKDLSEADLAAARERIRLIAQRTAEVRRAQAEAQTINNIVDSSAAAVEASVQRNLQLAAQLVEQNKISQADFLRYAETQLKRLTDLNQQAAEESTEFWKEAARGIQGALQTFFFDAMQGRLGNLLLAFKRVIDQMVAQALAARLAQALFGTGFEKGGAMGGFIGQAFDFLSGLFGGARANGGPVSAGKAYLVGEKGPELAYFGKSGTVIPNDALQGMGMQVNVTISAVDSKSFLDQISSVKRELAEAVGNANRKYNTRYA